MKSGPLPAAIGAGEQRPLRRGMFDKPSCRTWATRATVAIDTRVYQTFARVPAGQPSPADLAFAVRASAPPFPLNTAEHRDRRVGQEAPPATGA